MSEFKEMFGDVDFSKVDVQEDFSDEIPALRGDYKGEVKSFKFIESSTGGFYSLKVQVNETVKGIKGDNRYIDRTFNIAESEWATAEESKERLLGALKTIGATSPEEAVGKTICMKVRPNKDKRDKNGWPKHIVTIVKEFKAPTDGVTVDEAQSSAVPF